MANILASKIFISSSRQDKILSAIQDPINSELVQQMKSYLDEDFIAPEYLKDDNSNKDDIVDIRDSSNTQKDSSKPSFHPAHKTASSPASSFPGENYLDDDNNDETDIDETYSEPDKSSPDNNSLKDTSEDTSEEDDNLLDVHSSTDIESSLDSLRGLLNSREDCRGVSRISKKDNELWIYYSDDVNLNSVMTCVIETLAASNYSYLEFNRLARSNNAVVFDIVFQSVTSFEGDNNGKQ